MTKLFVILFTSLIIWPQQISFLNDNATFEEFQFERQLSNQLNLIFQPHEYYLSLKKNRLPFKDLHYDVTLNLRSDFPVEYQFQLSHWISDWASFVFNASVLSQIHVNQQLAIQPDYFQKTMSFFSILILFTLMFTFFFKFHVKNIISHAFFYFHRRTVITEPQISYALKMLEITQVSQQNKSCDSIKSLKREKSSTRLWKRICHLCIYFVAIFLKIILYKTISLISISFIFIKALKFHVKNIISHAFFQFHRYTVLTESRISQTLKTLEIERLPQRDKAYNSIKKDLLSPINPQGITLFLDELKNSNSPSLSTNTDKEIPAGIKICFRNSESPTLSDLCEFDNLIDVLEKDPLCCGRTIVLSEFRGAQPNSATLQKVIDNEVDLKKIICKDMRSQFDLIPHSNLKCANHVNNLLPVVKELIDKYQNIILFIHGQDLKKWEVFLSAAHHLQGKTSCPKENKNDLQIQLD